MDKADRDAVFRRANTRNLPIVFVNDEYIGDYDTLAALEEEGKLDKILMLSDEGMVSIEEHMKRLNALSE
jgi:glutaredoxin-related protein